MISFFSNIKTGVSGSIAAVLLPLMDEYVMPVVQYTGAILGLVLVVTSLWLNFKKLFKKKDV
jgi:hypothetical protein